MYLERLMVAFKQYSPCDPESGEAQQAVSLAYVNQSAPDIKRKLQSLEILGERSLRDLGAVTEKVYNKRDSENQKEERREREHQEREEKIDKRQERNLTKILYREQTQMERVLLATEAGGQDGHQ